MASRSTINQGVYHLQYEHLGNKYVKNYLFCLFVAILNMSRTSKHLNSVPGYMFHIHSIPLTEQHSTQNTNLDSQNQTPPHSDIRTSGFGPAKQSSLNHAFKYVYISIRWVSAKNIYVKVKENQKQVLLVPYTSDKFLSITLSIQHLQFLIKSTTTGLVLARIRIIKRGPEMWWPVPFNSLQLTRTNSNFNSLELTQAKVSFYHISLNH